MNPPTLTENTLRIERTFDASRERIFRAWTQKAEMERWYSPTADYRVVVTEADVRVGGRYRIEMHHTGGNVHIVSGVYREVSAPSRLAFTWQWQDGVPGETLVTVELHEAAGRTRMVFLHERFPNNDERDKHAEGWPGCFDRLTRALAG